MGWQAIKRHFQITHIVHVVAEGICIGSINAAKIVVINKDTGVIANKLIFSNQFLRENYPLLVDAKPSEILELINSKDIFETSLSVYALKGDGEIIEKQCEKYGFPNTTHDGELMYENTFFPSKKEAVENGVNCVLAYIKSIKRDISNLERALKDENLRLERERAHLDKLEALLQQLNA